MSSKLTPESLQASLESHFGNIAEPRIVTKSTHKLINIITIAVLAVLCGADGWVAVETYGKAKQDWLATFLDLSQGIPSHDTFGRVWSQLDPEQVEKNFQEWVKLIAEKLELKVVAIDGKSLKGSYDRESSLKALQMVSAWSTAHNLVLGQCAVEEKSNEITAIPLLLEQLELTGAIVTIDAMGTQRKIAQQIQAKQADYLLALKGNHQTLNNYAQDWFEENRESLEKIPEVRVKPNTCEAGHHRIEKRKLWQVPVEKVFPPEKIEQWKGLKTLVIEESHRYLWNQTTQSRRFFLSSLEPEFEAFADCIRGHWGIENQLHWCLDVIFQEDNSRVRKGHGARNLSLLRRLSLNLLRQETSKGSLKMKRYQAGLDNNFLLKILSDSGLF